jgi:hypothetical protein
MLGVNRMKYWMMIIFLFVFTTAYSAPVPCAWEQPCNFWTVRGDTNLDGVRDISDVFKITNWLFLGHPPPNCIRIADMTGNGNIDASDASYLANFLFNGGPAPAQHVPLVLDSCTCEQDIGINNPCLEGAWPRGDVDRDGDVTVLDLIKLRAWQGPAGGEPPRCLEAADWDNSGVIELNEEDFWSNFLFQGGPPPCFNGIGCPDPVGCIVDPP